jgi:hypothetical protein
MRLITKPNHFMRHLNSPPVFNSLETKIAESVPAGAAHILVVNAGDGRLARELKSKAPKAAVSVVTIQPELLGCVDDFSARSGNPWDVEWYAKQVAAHGPFDYVVFYQLHEFWRGELYSLAEIAKLARPGAVVWSSFLNAQSNRMISRFLPPVRLGFSSLADPLRAAVNVDFASYLDFVVKNGGSVVELWGMLDQNAQEYCEKTPGQLAQWELRGMKVSIGTFADAFLWGAAVVAVAFQTPGATAATPAPKVSFSPYSPNLLQALLLPYPDLQTRQGGLAAAAAEVAAWNAAPPQELGGLAKFFVNQVGDMEKPKRVLLLGSGWGRDLILLKRHYPAWDWVGFDHNEGLVRIGHEAAKGAKLEVATGELGESLPFADRSFDVVLSLGYFSMLYEPAAKALAKEVLRVRRGPVFHLEDGRGPEQGMQLKSYSLKAVYTELGVDSLVQPVLVDGSPMGMYMLKVSSPV